MVDLFANSGDPNQTPRSAASDADLHCLPITGLVDASNRVIRNILLLETGAILGALA